MPTDALSSFVKDDDIVLVAHLSQNEDESVLRRFDNLADRYSDRYSFVKSPPSADKSTSLLNCFNNLDGVNHTMSDLSSVHAMENLVSICATPVIVELSTRNELQYLGVSGLAIHRSYGACHRTRFRN